MSLITVKLRRTVKIANKSGLNLMGQDARPAEGVAVRSPLLAM
jgi:hypothetical protein